MIPATYSIVRCVPDPARGERFNIGVILWAPARPKVVIDYDCAKAAIARNPRLAADTLRSMQDILQAKADRAHAAENGKERFIRNQSGFPILVGDAMFIQINDETEVTITATMNRLVGRLVAPQGDDEEPAVEERVGNAERTRRGVE